MIQSALIAPRSIASNSSTAFRPGARRHRRRAPEPRRRGRRRRAKVHVGGELVGEPADLAPAHRVGLAGERERAAARLADAAGREMALRIALTLSVPCADWLTPWLKAVTTRRSRATTASKNAARSRSASAAVARRSSRDRRDRARLRERLARSPTCARRHRRGRRRRCRRSRPAGRQNSATSVPGAIGRCRSAVSAVAVRRGSIDDDAARRARLRLLMR